MQFSFHIRTALKADEILAEYEEAHAAEQRALGATKVHVPVTMKGYFVGTAEVLRDGTITVTTEPSEEGEQLRRLLLDGNVNHISLGPSAKDPLIKPIEIKGL